MSDVQAVTSLVCVPMCEAHTTHQLHSSNVSVHGVHTMETLARVCVAGSVHALGDGRANTASVHMHSVCPTAQPGGLKVYHAGHFEHFVSLRIMR